MFVRPRLRHFEGGYFPLVVSEWSVMFILGHCWPFWLRQKYNSLCCMVVCHQFISPFISFSCLGSSVSTHWIGLLRLSLYLFICLSVCLSACLSVSLKSFSEMCSSSHIYRGWQGETSAEREFSVMRLRGHPDQTIISDFVGVWLAAMYVCIFLCVCLAFFLSSCPWKIVNYC